MTAENLIFVNDAEFEDKVVNNSKAVVVDFFADWCGPCKTIAPLLEELAAENENIIIAKLDIDKNPLTPSKFGVRGIPTLVLYKDGKEQERVVGADDASIRNLVKTATN